MIEDQLVCALKSVLCNAKKGMVRGGADKVENNF